jgi:hypothetical protein
MSILSKHHCCHRRSRSPSFGPCQALGRRRRCQSTCRMVSRLRPHVRERKGRGGRRERQRRDCVQREEEACTKPRKREQVLVHVHAEPKQRRGARAVLLREHAPRERGCRRGERRRGERRGGGGVARRGRRGRAVSHGGRGGVREGEYGRDTREHGEHGLRDGEGHRAAAGASSGASACTTKWHYLQPTQHAPLLYHRAPGSSAGPFRRGGIWVVVSVLVARVIGVRRT